jgi:hypothetical protein
MVDDNVVTQRHRNSGHHADNYPIRQEGSRLVRSLASQKISIRLVQMYSRSAHNVRVHIVLFRKHKWHYSLRKSCLCTILRGQASYFSLTLAGATNVWMIQWNVRCQLPSILINWTGHLNLVVYRTPR